MKNSQITVVSVNETCVDWNCRNIYLQFKHSNMWLCHRQVSVCVVNFLQCMFVAGAHSVLATENKSGYDLSQKQITKTESIFAFKKVCFNEEKATTQNNSIKHTQ